jgi:LacI family transcriptional regulator
MELVIEQGHRRIAFIRGSDDQEDAHARLAGYRDTLARHRIEPDPDLIVAGDFQESGGLQAVNQLLTSGARFSAIFAANDLSAYGARLALYRRSIRVPEDVSIIGFDDLHSSMYTTPPLTTVRQPLYDVGSCIGTMMLGMIGHDEVKVPLPALSLVVRESVRRLT